MNRNDIIDLLSVAAAYDRRTIGEADIAAWSEAARRATWDARKAVDAIHEHYAQTSKWIMPGHITEQIRIRSRQPAPAGEVLQLNPAPPATAERRAEVMAAVRKLADRKTMP